MRQAGEPSVEEILESIKKVIARDNRTEAAEVRRTREVQGMAAAPREVVRDDDVFDLSEADEFDDDAADEEAPLIRAEARSTISESLAALAILSAPGAVPQIVRSGETSLEGMARDLLRPALAEWLDKNLPPLVERMVASEIARIVGKKG